MDGTARPWAVEPAWEDSTERINLWIEVAAGLALDRDTGAVRALGADEWRERRRRLDALTDPFALRLPGRQLVERAPWIRRAADLVCRPGKLAAALCQRVRDCYARKGYRGLARALTRRLTLVRRRVADRHASTKRR